MINVKHKIYVFWFLLKIAARLVWRGLVHDMSKFGWTEFYLIIPALPPDRAIPFNTPEYQTFLDKAKPAIDHHYAMNTHHPEHYGDYKKMSMLDLVEMACDWRAASMRKFGGGDFEKSFEQCQTRFGITDETMTFLRTLKKEI